MFPVHADAAIEMAASLVRPHARLIVASNSQVPSMPVSPELARAIASEGATVVSGRRQVLSAMKSVDVAILGVPRQVEEFERVVHGGVWRVPFVVRHGFNAFDELAVLGVPGFMSPSASAVGTMSSRLPSCRTFQSRKVVSPRSIRQGSRPVRGRASSRTSTITTRGPRKNPSSTRSRRPSPAGTEPARRTSGRDQNQAESTTCSSCHGRGGPST